MVNSCINGSETSQLHNEEPWFGPKNDENRVPDFTQQQCSHGLDSLDSVIIPPIEISGV
jgi:hypothetical protein